MSKDIQPLPHEDAGLTQAQDADIDLMVDNGGLNYIEAFRHAGAQRVGALASQEVKEKSELQPPTQLQLEVPQPEVTMSAARSARGPQRRYGRKLDGTIDRRTLGGRGQLAADRLPPRGSQPIKNRRR